MGGHGDGPKATENRTVVSHGRLAIPGLLYRQRGLRGLKDGLLDTIHRTVSVLLPTLHVHDRYMHGSPVSRCLTN